MHYPAQPERRQVARFAPSYAFLRSCRTTLRVGSRLRARAGQHDAECRAGAGIFETELAAVRLDSPFRDREAQARPTPLAGSPFIDSIKPVEDAGAMLRRNAGALVLHG